MEVREAIESRRSIGRVTQDEVTKDVVQEILSSAVHAPNHRITEPWRFHVFSGKGRGEFAKARAEVARRLAEADGEEEDLARGRVSRERKKAFRAPLIIVVTANAGRDEIETLENYGACCAAVQNMQLTAHSLGLGSIWRTGPLAYHEYMREYFMLSEDDTIVAFLYLGYPDLPETRRRRQPVEEMTTWHES